MERKKMNTTIINKCFDAHTPRHIYLAKVGSASKNNQDIQRLLESMDTTDTLDIYKSFADGENESEVDMRSLD